MTARDVKACLEVGVARIEGNVGTRNPEEAGKRFKAACDGAEMTGCVRLGILHVTGLGVEKSEEKAEALFTKACEAEDMNGCAARETPLHQPQRKACEEVRTLACEGGSMEGCLYLGQLYLEGIGVKANSKKHATHFEPACDSEVMEACTNLGVMLMRGGRVRRTSLKRSCSPQRAKPRFNPPATTCESSNNNLPPEDVSCALWSALGWQRLHCRSLARGPWAYVLHLLLYVRSSVSPSPWGPTRAPVELPFVAEMDLKILFVISQVLGYATSKFLGIKIVSEMPPARRAIAIVTFIGLAELALLLMAILPTPWNALALFLNGLPLGMMRGLVFGFLEGRTVSDILGAGLCASFIVASGL